MIQSGDGETAKNEEGIRKKEEEMKEKDGKNLLGRPTFDKLENGRLKCVETGHELPENSIESYIDSKHCRLGLIDSALFLNKSPLNMFRQDPLTRTKLICKLTGVSINKSEEHIWKHINGRKFLNMLGLMLVEKKEAKGMEEEKRKEKSLMKKKTEKNVEEIISAIRNFSDEESDSEEDEDFWMPESDLETNDDVEDDVDEEMMEDAEELSNSTKRMTIEIGPSSFASRKKKKKPEPT